MEITGTIKLIGQTETVGEKGFKKRLVVITTNEQYPQSLPVEFVKDKTSLLDNFTECEQVKCSINLRGSEYNGKYYCNIQGWKIESDGGKKESNVEQKGNSTEFLDGNSNNLPF